MRQRLGRNEPRGVASVNEGPDEIRTAGDDMHRYRPGLIFAGYPQVGLMIPQDDDEKNEGKCNNCAYEQKKTKCFNATLALPAAIFFHLMGGESTTGSAAQKKSLALILVLINGDFL